MSDADLGDLYQEVILHHSRAPRNRGVAAGANRVADGHNPLCGDRCHLTARVEGGRIEDLRIEGQGCAISTAAASVMTDAVKGRTVEEARGMMERFHALVTAPAASSEAPPPAASAAEAKLAAFAGVRKFPVRVKCAMLAWRTLEAALEQESAPVTTE